MLLFIGFVALALLVAGLFAVFHGDTAVMVGLLVILALVVFVAVPQVVELTQHLQQVIDAKLPVAMR